MNAGRKARMSTPKTHRQFTNLPITPYPHAPVLLSPPAPSHHPGSSSALAIHTGRGRDSHLPHAHSRGDGYPGDVLLRPKSRRSRSLGTDHHLSRSFRRICAQPALLGRATPVGLYCHPFSACDLYRRIQSPAPIQLFARVGTVRACPPARFHRLYPALGPGNLLSAGHRHKPDQDHSLNWGLSASHRGRR